MILIILKVMDVNQLAEMIFVKNWYNNEMSFDLNQYMSKQQLVHILYSLFMKGLVLLFGHNQQLTLNKVTEEQLSIVSMKLRLAHVKTNVQIVDKDMAILLDYIPENTHGIPLELYVVRENQKENSTKSVTDDIRDYVFQMYLNGRLIRLSFDILRCI